MVTSKWKSGTFAAAILLIASQAWAQRQAQPQVPAQPAQPRLQQNQPQQRTTLRPVEGRAGENMADHQIATWLLMCNETEVQLAQIAVKQAHNKQVRDFAEKMIKEHTDLVSQLRAFAPDAPMLGQAGQERAGARDDKPQRDDAQQQAKQQPAQPQQDAQQQTLTRSAQPGQAGAQAHNGLPINEISRQLAERSLNTARQELGRKQGAEFDKCFVGMQIFEHNGMLNTLEVLRPYASGQLAGIVEKAIQPTQAHLEHAKQLMEELASAKDSDAKQSKTGHREDREEKENQQQ